MTATRRVASIGLVALASLAGLLGPKNPVRATSSPLEVTVATLVADSAQFGDFYPCPTIGGRVCQHQEAVALSVIDLDTGASVAVNGGVLMTPASAVKAVWMAAAISDIGAEAVEPFAGPVFVNSSNPAAASVIDLLGPLCHEGVDRLNTIVADGFGIPDLLLNSWYDCRSAYSTRPPWGSNRVTTDALARFWAKLARGDLLDPEDTERLLEWAAVPRNEWGSLLLARLPPGTTVSYKAGWMAMSNGSRISAGVVTTPSGRHFAIAVAVRAYSASYGTGAAEWSAYASCVVAYAVIGVGHDCRRSTDPAGLAAIDTSDDNVVLAQRIAGADRYATSVEISRATFAPRVATAYVATGLNFPDALAAGAVAGREGSPVLLVSPDAIPGVVWEELHRLNPGRIVVVGGSSVVSAGVEAELATLAPTVRLGGANRFETAALLAADAFPDGAVTVFIATGYDWREALPATPAATQAEAPILLTEPGRLPEATRRAIAHLAPELIVMLGGPQSLSPVVESELLGLAPTVERVAGADHFETAALLAARFPAPTRLFLATDAVFADSLAGAAAAATLGSPLLLVAPNRVPEATLATLRGLSPVEATILGGPNAVSDLVAAVVAQAAGIA